ncbi:actin-related protein 6-like, partial [Plakobranchus ocellatus]
LKGPKNTISRDYILPDYTHIKRGHVRPPEDSGKSKGDEQMIRMNNERFAVPELLFRPSDVGIQEMGISEGVMHCINLVEEDIYPCFLVLLHFSPITYPWHAGCDFCLEPSFPSLCVSRHEYEEHGHNICSTRFNVSSTTPS